MSVELLYTSAPTGLKQGSRGFCTVLTTSGTPVNLATRLETLSGYRHVFPPQDPQAALNPVAWSHVRVNIAGQPTSILSRVAAHGVDYSGRTNKLAHHLVIQSTEAPAAGPAWLLSQPGLMRTSWDGNCQTPATGPPIPSGNTQPSICHQWQAITGDAGWAGVVAETMASPAGKPLWIIYKIEQRDELLALLSESIALLPQEQRWQATFSTYYTNLPPEIDCKIRCVLAETEEARLASAKGGVIDLTQTIADAPMTSATSLARTGKQKRIAHEAPIETPLVSNEKLSPLSNLSHATATASYDSSDVFGYKYDPSVKPIPTDVSLAPQGPPKIPTLPARRAQSLLFAFVTALSIIFISSAGWIARKTYSTNTFVAAAVPVVPPKDVTEPTEPNKEGTKPAEISHNEVDNLRKETDELINVSQQKFKELKYESGDGEPGALLMDSIKTIETQFESKQKKLSEETNAINEQLSTISTETERLNSQFEASQKAAESRDIKISNNPREAFKMQKMPDELIGVKNLYTNSNPLFLKIAKFENESPDLGSAKKAIENDDRDANLDREVIKEIEASIASLGKKLEITSRKSDLNSELKKLDLIRESVNNANIKLKEWEGKILACEKSIELIDTEIAAQQTQWAAINDRANDAKKTVSVLVERYKPLQPRAADLPIKLVLSLVAKPNTGTKNQSDSGPTVSLLGYSEIKLADRGGVQVFKWTNTASEGNKQALGELKDIVLFEDFIQEGKRHQAYRIATLKDPCQFEFQLDVTSGTLRTKFEIKETESGQSIKYNLPKCIAFLGDVRKIIQEAQELMNRGSEDIGTKGIQVLTSPSFSETAKELSTFMSMTKNYKTSLIRDRDVLNARSVEINQKLSTAMGVVKKNTGGPSGSKEVDANKEIAANCRESIKKIEDRLTGLKKLEDAITSCDASFKSLQQGEKLSIGRLSIGRVKSAVSATEFFWKRDFNFELVVPKFPN